MTGYPKLIIILWLFPVICNSQSPAVQLKIDKATGFAVLQNGYCGTVIPWKTAVQQKQFNLAPIQSLVYANGAHSDNTINYLVSPTPPITMKVNLVEQSESKIVLQLTYTFQKKRFQYGKQTYPRGEAGPGRYMVTFTLQRSEKVIMIEEESDYDVAYSFKISNGLSPNRARYRGWNSTAPANGYEPDGKIYRSEGVRGYPLDASVDIQYSKTASFPRLTLWEPAGGEINTGRYWQFFNSGAGKSGNLLGFFQGRPSRLLGGRAIGPRLQVNPADTANGEKEDAEINVTLERRGPDNSWYPQKRYEWGLFISTMADLSMPDKVQPIGRWMNRKAGLGNKIEEYADKPIQLNRSFYDAGIYMPSDKIKALREKIKSDKEFYDWVCRVDAAYKEVWDAWRFPDSARSLIGKELGYYEDLKKRYVSGEGVFDFENRYWMGTLRFKLHAIKISCLFSDPAVRINPGDKRKLQSLVGLMARIVWDDNNVPLFDSAGINFGPANMVYQYRNNGRIFFALLCAADPEFTERARRSAKMVNEDIDNAVYEDGASIGTPHYTQATMDPILFSVLQLKQAGVADLFQTNPRLKRFANFYKSLLTPPSSRFAGNRKLVSLGDGSEESAGTFALLASGFSADSPDLSRELYSIYFHGPPRASLSGPVTLATYRGEMPKLPVTIETSSYPEYLVHFRSSLGNADESALWMLTGEGLFDHRHDDEGQVALYALQAPLSLSSSSFYTPSASDARIKSMLVPASEFPEWNAGDQPVNKRSLTNRTWKESELLSFGDLGDMAAATVRQTNNGNEWYRRVVLLSRLPHYPIFIFYDSTSKGEPAIWSLPMMSEGVISTPAGPIEALKRLYNTKDHKELPMPTPVKKAMAGLNTFGFKGQSWPAHPSEGIDWLLVTQSSESREYNFSEWATTWQNPAEVDEYFATNKRRYSESQQIFRMKGAHPFFNLLLPYSKSDSRYPAEVSSVPGSGIRVKYLKSGDIYQIWPDRVWIRTRQESALYALGKSYVENEGYSIEGGPASLKISGEKVSVRIYAGGEDIIVKLPFAVRIAGKASGVQVAADGRAIRFMPAIAGKSQSWVDIDLFKKN